MAWQFRNPDSTSVEDAIDEVKRNRGELTSSLARHFLKLTIRPFFVKAKPSSVTDTGRKVTTTVLPPKMTADNMDDTVNKPWKSGKNDFALDLLAWVVQVLDEKLLEEVWPMIVPPVLTLIDDWEPKYKRLGAELVQQLLSVTPPILLERTGLGEVFEGALMPCLTFLPTVTLEQDSIDLLSAVFPALLALSRVRYPLHQTSSTKVTSTALERPRTKFLDTVVRKGVISGYNHCSQYPRIISVLFNNLVPLLNELGVDSVKHLKYILPIITHTLSHPSTKDQTATLISAARALQAVMLNAWPRISEHRGDVLKGLTLCWLGQTDERTAAREADVTAVAELNKELKTAVEMLRGALGNASGFEEDCATLITADKRLGGLLRL